MAELFLVRHAQASFGTDDYDRLSELGHRQSRWLGEYFAQRGMSFDRVITGSLRRHRETLEGMCAGGMAAPTAERHAGLDEYLSDLLVHAWRERTGAAAPTPGGDRREHFRLVRDALSAWVDGTFTPQGHLSFADFVAGTRQAIDLARNDPNARRVLVVSSGGPIATVLSWALGAELRTMVNLNLQMRNASFSEFRYNARVFHCVSFNNIPHMDSPERRDLVTYS